MIFFLEMPISMSDRSATAAITGYLYQFNATITQILSSGPHAATTIEGIEDLDVAQPSETELIQCKYYEKTRLTPAVLRNIVLPMLTHYLGTPPGLRGNFTYRIYGHFKDSELGERPISLKELRTALVRRKRLPDGSKVSESLHHILGFDDDLIRAFADRLELQCCKKFDDHLNELYEQLSAELSVSVEEIELHYYPNAISLISHLATRSNVSERVITKTDLIHKLNSSNRIFNRWLLRINKNQHYANLVRRSLFSDFNINATNRIFCIETKDTDDIAKLLKITRALEDKWSTKKRPRTPVRDRYAPLVFYRSLEASILSRLKQELADQGTSITDGYQFQGAKFRIQSFLANDNLSNPITIRFLNNESDFYETVSKAPGRTIIYDFYTTKPLEIESSHEKHDIPVPNVELITEIV